MDKIAIIQRMRERKIKWDDIAYSLDTTAAAAKMLLKRKLDIDELGEKPVIKKSKFDTPVVLRVKELARNDGKKAIRDFGADLAKEFPGKTIPSFSTIHRILRDSGFKVVALKKKTLIWPRNQMKRVDFCREMAEKGPVFWDTIIWSDETTVRQRPVGKEMKVRVHSSEAKSMEQINPQVHSGGFSVMFWGCFSKLGLGPLVALEGTMNAEKYIELLKDTIIPELAAAGRPMTFMQDNAPCHTANVVKAFMEENGIETLKWPPQSPDMNPIENLWAIVKARRQKKYGLPKSKNQLIDQIFDIWDNIEPKLVQNLAESGIKRVKAVLKLKGKVSKY
jgi:transposase